MPNKPANEKNEGPAEAYALCLADLMSAETQILAFLPTVIEQVTSPELKSAIEGHQEETKAQKDRLDAILGKQKGSNGKQEGGKSSDQAQQNKVVQRLLADATEITKKKTDDKPIDLELAMALSKVEHFEISSYRAACSLAESMGDKDDLNALKTTLAEEDSAAVKVESIARAVLGLPESAPYLSHGKQEAQGTGSQQADQPSQQERTTMPRNQEESRRGGSSSYQERDDQGRFTSSQGGSGNGRGRDDDDYRGRGRDDDMRRDDQGRFMSSGGGGRGREDYNRGRDYDDDRGGRGQGQGGWFGDSRGHSEAAREGWEHRRGEGGYGQQYGRGGSDYERAGRGRDDYDRGGRGGQDYGRGGQDYERGGRSGRDDYERGGRGGQDYSRGGEGRGWYGDPEGHSEAAREDWENRRHSSDSSSGGQGYGSRDYDDDRGGRGRGQGGSYEMEGSRSRGGNRRDDDDDRGRGHGGWFGDSEGHSRAAREGWRDRDR